MIDKEDCRPDKKSTLYIRNLDHDAKAFFKAYCVRRGMSMCKVVEKFMRECARKERRAVHAKLDVRKARRFNRRRLLKKKYGRVPPVKKEVAG